MEPHPYQLFLQPNGQYGLAKYLPLLDEVVQVPPEFLEYEMARIGEFLNTPPLDTSPVDVWNGSMPSTASRGTLSSASAPSSDPPLPLSSPTSGPPSSSDRWGSSHVATGPASTQEASKAPHAAKSTKAAGDNAPGWERREVACLACRRRKCRVSLQSRMVCKGNDADRISARALMPMVVAIGVSPKG
jgi:hypothetical protein